MMNNQQPTHKWKPPISDLILEHMRGKGNTTPSRLAKTLGMQQATISQTMINLERKGILRREVCPCGRGFVYWRKGGKHG